MKNKMIFITVFSLVCFFSSLLVFLVIRNDISEIITITFGVTFYHFAMRLLVGGIVNLIMKNKANYKNAWFREKRFEKKLYKFIGVRKWKKHIPTYSPETFNSKEKSISEIIGATCQAEIVHELIMLFSLLPMILIPFLGGAVAFIVTSIISMLIDFIFVIIQRYNRPKLVKVMQRYEKLR